MPNRMLRDWTYSEKIHRLSVEAERFFTRLIMKVDDFGRYYGNSKLLRASLFPLHNRLKEEKVIKWINECEKADLLLIYEVDGKKYLEIKFFDQKLKVRRSKYPPSSEEDRIELKNGYVYVIGSSFEKPVKIGFSINPWSRLKEISVNHPEKLELLISIKGEKRLESLLHKELSKFKVNGEWFSLERDMIDCLLSISKESLSIDEIITAVRSLVTSNYDELRRPELEVEPEVEKKGREQERAPAQDLSESNLFRKPIIPTKQQVFEAITAAGGTREMAKSFYEKYEATGWYLQGSPIVSYSALAQKFVANWKSNEKSKGTEPEIIYKPL